MTALGDEPRGPVLVGLSSSRLRLDRRRSSERRLAFNMNVLVIRMKAAIILIEQRG